MTFDELIIYTSLVTGVISLFAFIYSGLTARLGYPIFTGIWSLTLSYGPSSAYSIVKGQLVVKRQFLGELHGQIVTEHSKTDFKGRINRHGMIQGTYSSPEGLSGSLLLLLKADGKSAEGQYMAANKNGSISQGLISLKRAASQKIQRTKKDAPLI